MLVICLIGSFLASSKMEAACTLPIPIAHGGLSVRDDRCLSAGAFSSEASGVLAGNVFLLASSLLKTTSTRPFCLSSPYQPEVCRALALCSPSLHAYPLAPTISRPPSTLLHLPDALLASKKRSSSNSSTSISNKSSTSSTSTSGRGGESRSSAGGGGGKSDRSSSGSAASNASMGSVSVWSVDGEDGEGAWSGIDWDNLNSHTVRPCLGNMSPSWNRGCGKTCTTYPVLSLRLSRPPRRVGLPTEIRCFISFLWVATSS